MILRLAPEIAGGLIINEIKLGQVKLEAIKLLLILKTCIFFTSLRMNINKQEQVKLG